MCRINKTVIILALVDAAFLTLFCFTSSAADFLPRFADASFLAGLLSVLIGLSCMVRNGGIFKAFSTLGYKMYRRNMKGRKEMGQVKEDERIMDIAEYTIKKYEEKWNGKPFYLNGAALIAVFSVISYLLQ